MYIDQNVIKDAYNTIERYNYKNDEAQQFTRRKIHPKVVHFLTLSAANKFSFPDNNSAPTANFRPPHYK